MAGKRNPNCIIIRSGYTYNQRTIYSCNDFFYHSFKYVFKDNVLYFNHVDIDDKGKIHQMYRANDHSFQAILKAEWPLGKYPIDPDSTEDQLIIDLNNPSDE